MREPTTARRAFPPIRVRRFCRRETAPVTDRMKFALLFLVLFCCVSVRPGGASGATKHLKLGATKHAKHVKRRAAKHVSKHVSRATTIAREQRKLVHYARHFLGVRYVYGGTSPHYGFDCSGFTRFVYAHFGIALPHYSGAQFDVGRRVARTALRPGDLVFFDRLGHVGIYVGRGRFVHAPHSGTSVSVEPLAGWYASRYSGARRLL